MLNYIILYNHNLHNMANLFTFRVEVLPERAAGQNEIRFMTMHVIVHVLVYAIS